MAFFVCMRLPHRHHRYTYAEYAALENFASEKHEFLDGEIYAMAGGTADHAALSAAMVSELRRATRSRGCRAYTSDLRLYVESVGLATYPDASVICGPLQQHAPSPESTVLNPHILVEVTSNPSEEYDTGSKLEFYRGIPTLREYIVVSHRERRITFHVRGADGQWTTSVAVRGETVEIPSLAASLLVDEIYSDSTVA